MTNPINKLPQEIRTKIKEFASDKTPPTPTAEILKHLQFRYFSECQGHIPYRPARLMVWVDDNNCTRFVGIRECWLSRNSSFRRFYRLSDFLPSYWSDFADTHDSKVYDDPDMERRLQCDMVNTPIVVY